MEHFADRLLQELKRFLKHLIICCKWILLSLVIGCVLGLICTAFSKGLTFVTELRLENGFIIWLLPICGLLITFLYEKLGTGVSRGTNMAIAAVNSDEKIPFVMLPLIFVSTILSHLFGASVGREGAALQMGASVGNSFSRILSLSENDKKILIMSGMSAAFSALFGTPLAAAVFSLEVISVGVMYYAALVPCAVSALTALSVARIFGVGYASYQLVEIPEFTPFTAGMTAVIGVLCALLSIILCAVLILSERGFTRFLKNPYIKAVVSGLFIAAFTLLLGTQDYNGLGISVIHSALSGNALWYAFLIKILMTAVSLAGGYKGGEIVPAMFIGATFGCAVGGLLGMPPAFCAALGMTAVFCGVTNSPLASILIGIELFGTKGLWFFCLVIAISYMLSDYYGLYKSQLIVYSKYRSVYVRKSAKR